MQTGGMSAPETPTSEPSIPAEEPPKPMHEVHPPHETVHSWRGFLIHIATIVIGLLIAVGLEQTVEMFHDRHQRHLLEEQMHEVFESNILADAASLKQLGSFRAYLVDLRAAIVARQQGQSMPIQPAVDDARMAIFPRFPNLAAYEAAKDNGTIALLPTDRIRLYNRVAFQREMLVVVREHLFDGFADLSSFQERFVDSTGSLALGEVVVAPALSVLSAGELDEYRRLVAALIKKTDLYMARLRLFDLQCRAILSGVRTEDDLVKYITPKMIADARNSDGPPADVPSAPVDDPVVGTWKLNVEKSRFNPGPGWQSQIRVYENTAAGISVKWTGVNANGAKMQVSYTYKYDGQDYPMAGSESYDALNAVRMDALTVKSEEKRDGKTVGIAVRSVSPDGKVLTITDEGMNKKGLKFSQVLVFDR
jgi:hypothetical protein